ncbi:MAG: NADH-quinone oxidoreductase subunit M [Pseudomonadota bacterium]|nr:NADH-quinone oxidoreductase subunit M [Pseudomonadota bacterium]
MPDFPLLSILLCLPLAGSLLILLLARDDSTAAQQRAKVTALGTSLATFVLSLGLWVWFDPANSSFQFEESIPWMPTWGISWRLGVDGISMPFVLLSTFLTPVCILSAWSAIKKRVREFMVAFLVLETLMVGVFASLDIVLFYVFFEGVLIPMFLIIGIWGGARRIYASFKFFLYTLLGSVLMLLAVLALYLKAGTTDIPTLMTTDLPATLQTWLWLAFFASFAVKVPMWPVHTWLPDAHVEAPTAGSVILAGVLLKMGGYGFLRFSIPIFPQATEFFTPLVFGLSVVAIIYTSLVALVQKDMKKLIAYSSVAHMGFVTLGMFSLNEQGIQGSMFQMLSHGLVSGALFLCVGVVYDRLHTREIARYGGLVNIMPRYAVVFMVFMLASVGLPGTSGFVGEFLSLQGAFMVRTWVAALAALGVILGAAYMLLLYRRVVFGPVVHEDVRTLRDLTWRETVTFVPVVALVLWMGIYPGPVLDISAASVRSLITDYQARLAAARKAADLAPFRLEVSGP